MSCTGIGSRSARPDTYRINAYSVRGGDIGRRGGRHLARIVHAVGQQDDHLALGIAFAEPVDSRGQAVAYRRTVLYHAGTNLPQQRLERTPVGRQGTLRETLTREGHDTDAVVGSVGHEFGGHVLCRRDTVGFKVAGQHAGRYVHRQHDIDTFGGRGAPLLGVLRPGQRHHEQRHRRTAQYERQVPRPIPHPSGHSLQRDDRRDAQRRTAPADAPHIKRGHRQQQDQQPQQFRIGELRYLHAINSMVLNKGSTRLPVLSRPGHTDRTLGIYLLTRPVLLLLHGIQNILGILTAHAARSLLLSGLPFRPGVIPGTSAVVPVVGAVVPVGVVPVIRTVISTLVTVLRTVPILLPVAVAVLISILVLVLVLVLIPVVASAALLLLLFEQFLDIRKIVFRFKVGRIFTKRLLVEIGRLFQFLLCRNMSLPRLWKTLAR